LWTALDLIAVGYSLGLAASVLWLGAVGDRYGRKLLLILGISLSVPACLVAGVGAVGHRAHRRPHRRWLSAGMAYPTTLALIKGARITLLCG
jgi:MFS transporter, DHA2 family, multidrug resistance protein